MAALRVGWHRPDSLASALWRTARPRQWSKNLLVFAAPGAAGVLTVERSALRAALAFVVFCCVSSATYFLNDLLDAEADRIHPVKRLRPVAAGLVSPRMAGAVAVALTAVGLGAGVALGWRLLLAVAIYLAVQIAYNLRLKREPVYDLGCVAAGFVLRAVAGGVAVGVPVSEQFLVVAMFGSLLMVTGKRLAEQRHLGDDAAAHRPILHLYSPEFLRIVLAIAAGGAIFAYSEWALSLQTALRHHADPLWYQFSIVPVVLGLLRYVFLVDRGRGARPEELVFSDPSLVVLGTGWLTLFALGVYAS